MLTGYILLQFYCIILQSISACQKFQLPFGIQLIYTENKFDSHVLTGPLKTESVNSLACGYRNQSIYANLLIDIFAFKTILFRKRHDHFSLLGNNCPD